MVNDDGGSVSIHYSKDVNECSNIIFKFTDVVL